MIGLLVRLGAVLGLLGLQMAMSWGTCPECGRGHSTTSPGDYCSSVCRGAAARKRALGGGKSGSRDSGWTEKNRPKSEPFSGSRKQTGKHRNREETASGGKHGAAPAPSGGWCSFVTGGLALAPVALVALAVRLARR